MIFNFIGIALFTSLNCLVTAFPESTKLSTIKKSSSKYVSSRSIEFDSCYSKGTLYTHGSNLTRSDDPCEKCFCYKGSILCWNINCPKSMDRQGCKELKIKDLCCPILECPLAVKDAVFKDLSERQPRFSSSSSSSSLPDSTGASVTSLSSLGLTSITKEVACKYGQEKYKPGQRVTINPMKPCQRCFCGPEGKVKCELLSTCKEEIRDKDVNRKKKEDNSESKSESGETKENDSNVSSFSTRTIPDSVLKRVQNLLHKVSTHNLTSIKPKDLD